MMDLRKVEPEVEQDSMSSAFGMGDLGGGVATLGDRMAPADRRVEAMFGGVISMEEIMRETAATENWESDVMDSESDFGGDGGEG
ncbi:unnamed protein product, partial [Discosporangium mesarthrocarpum]